MPFGSTPVVKPGAFDPEVLSTGLPRDLVREHSGGEFEMARSLAWMQRLDSTKRLTFAGYRESADRTIYALLLSCDPVADRLRLHPLGRGESPLDALSDPERRRTLQEVGQRLAAPTTDEAPVLVLPLHHTITEHRLGPPLPPPRHVFAAALNFPSHLEHDLVIPDPARYAPLMRAARARVFLKHPPTEAPGVSASPALSLTGVVGPYDVIEYAPRIALPSLAGGPHLTTRAVIDYEAEVGAVVGRSLSRADIEAGGDDVIREAIAGYVLVSDTKARNPQVLDKILDRGSAPDDALYRIGHPDLDAIFGRWDENTCRWWSYAASWGNFAAVGPFFVAAEGDVSMPARALACARTYAEAEARGHRVPPGRSTRTPYLRQCTLVTEDASHADGMLWSIPDIVRSILAPDSALAFLGPDLQLEPGDILSLGTPGGAVITNRSRRLVGLLRRLLFWWSPVEFHDKFFGRDEHLYLHPGDEIFFWADGLGFQRHRLAHIRPRTL